MVWVSVEQPFTTQALCKPVSNMPKYHEVEKNGRTFTPLRAVGLAVEVAHRTGSVKGCGMVSQGDLATVVLTGSNLRVRDASRGGWRKTRGPVHLELREEDQALALQIFKKQRVALWEAGLNIWSVDVRIPGHLGSHDLIGDFSCPAPPVLGLVSVELKVTSSTRFKTEHKRWLEECSSRFHASQLHQKSRPSAFQGQVLVSCQVPGAGRHGWGDPKVHVEVWIPSRSMWSALPAHVQTEPKKIAAKPSIQTVLRELPFFKGPGRTEVALASHFLKAVGAKVHNVGERAQLWNKMLADDGVGQGVFLQKVRFKAGCPAWVGTRTTFRHVYKHL